MAIQEQLEEIKATIRCLAIGTSLIGIGIVAISIGLLLEGG